MTQSEFEIEFQKHLEICKTELPNELGKKILIF